MRHLITAAFAALILHLSSPPHAATGPNQGVPLLATARLMAFSASTDLSRTRRFYHDILGLTVVEENPMVIVFSSAGTQLRISKVEKPVVAPYTVLGWKVANLKAAVASLVAKGVVLERFQNMMPQDADAIATFPNGDRVVWFKDPDGHLLSLTQFSR